MNLTTPEAMRDIGAPNRHLDATEIAIEARSQERDEPTKIDLVRSAEIPPKPRAALRTESPLANEPEVEHHADSEGS